MGEAVGDDAEALREQAERHRATLDELEASHAELERSNRDLGEMASIAAHDLKSPLTTIGGYANLLLNLPSVRSDPEALGYVERIDAGVGRLSALIDDLLAFSQLGSGYEPELVDTAALVADVLDGLAADVAAAGAVVTIGEIPDVNGDAMQLQQLFQNLLGNAMKFRQPERRVEVGVTAERAGEWCVFAVADNGIGIEPRHRDYVFKMFQRVQRGGDQPGTGIGLAICRRIIENHGGRIWIDETRGGGATFRFTLRAAVDE